jgi:hypothetical protein
VKSPILVVPLVFLLCFEVGCQNKAEKAELEQFRAQAALEEQNKALMKSWEEAWDKGDFDALRKLIGPECVWYMPSSIVNTQSEEEMIEAMELIHNSLPEDAERTPCYGRIDLQEKTVLIFFTQSDPPVITNSIWDRLVNIANAALTAE